MWIRCPALLVEFVNMLPVTSQSRAVELRYWKEATLCSRHDVVGEENGRQAEANYVAKSYIQ